MGSEFPTRSFRPQLAAKQFTKRCDVFQKNFHSSTDLSVDDKLHVESSPPEYWELLGKLERRLDRRQIPIDACILITYVPHYVHCSLRPF